MFYFHFVLDGRKTNGRTNLSTAINRPACHAYTTPRLYVFAAEDIPWLVTADAEIEVSSAWQRTQSCHRFCL